MRTTLSNSDGHNETPQGDDSVIDGQPDVGRRGRWSDEDLAELRRWYGLKDEQFLARELGRTPAAIRRMAAQVFDGPVTSGPWTGAEVDRLRQYLGGLDLEMVSRIIGRSLPDVEAKLVELATRLGEARLGSEDLVRFKRLYGTRTDEDLAIVFGRKLEVIKAHAAELCLSKDKAFMRRATGGVEKTTMPRWSQDELIKLKDLYPRTSNLEIAQVLGRSVKSVVSKAHNLGLKKDKARLQQMGRQNVRLRYERESGAGQGGTGQAGSNQASPNQASPNQFGPNQSGPGQNGAGEVSPGESSSPGGSTPDTDSSVS